MMHRSVLLSLLAAVVLSMPDCLLADPPTPQDEAPVVVVPAGQRTIAAAQLLVGTVVPTRRSTVGSAVDGRVVEFLVNEGDAVRKDQPVAQLRTGTLEIQLRGALAEQRLRDAELSELRNGSRPEEIKQAAEELAAAAAILKATRSRYDRAKSLFSRQAINEEQMQDALAKFDETRAAHAAAEARHQLLVNGPRREQIERAQAQLDAQAEQVRLLEDQIARHTIRSPFDGFVSMEHTEVGQWVGRGDPVVEVIELATVDVQVFVLGRYLNDLRIGADVQVRLPALETSPGDGPAGTVGGRVESIAPQADTRSRTFPVRVRMQNRIAESGPMLRSGMLAEVTLPVGEQREALFVPKDALVLGGSDPTVFVLSSGASQGRTATVRAVRVRTGVMQDADIEVSGSLRPGDLVVVRGNERLKDGQQVLVATVQGAATAEEAR